MKFLKVLIQQIKCIQIFSIFTSKLDKDLRSFFLPVGGKCLNQKNNQVHAGEKLGEPSPGRPQRVTWN